MLEGLIEVLWQPVSINYAPCQKKAILMPSNFD